MPQAISINIGLNQVDPNHYGGWSGQLRACESDARDMTRIAQARGFETKTILTREATADAVTSAITDAAGKLEAGDILFLTNSSHGGQVPDTNGDESDQLDETWVTYDRQLVDDELYDLWSKFAAGTRIFVLSDSCHSGTVDRGIFDAATPSVVQAGLITPEPRTKDMPKDVEERTYEQNKAEYDAIQKEHPSAETVEIAASVILISGCQDNQFSLDGDKNGLFTQQLLAVWDDGKWSGSYPNFHKAIGKKMPATQSPNYNPVGATDSAFAKQVPLTI
jgi:metacaspase-1